MKKIISAILIAVLLLTVAAPALAADKVTATGSANLRKGPGLDYATVGSVKKGTQLTYKGSTSTDERGVKWYKVSYKGSPCWISSKYAKLGSSGSSGSSGSKPTTSAKKKVTTTGSVNLRKGPGLDYASLGSVPSGSSFKYLDSVATDDRGVKWYKVSYNGSAAWISSKYSKLSGASAGGSSSASLPKPSTSASNRVTTTGNVNLRKGAGLNYAKVATVAKGSTLKYLGQTKKDGRGVKWYKVSYNGNACWISSKYCKLKTSGSNSSSSSNASTATAKPAATESSDFNDYLTTTPEPVSPFTSTPDLTNDSANGFSVTPVATAPADYVEISQYYMAKLVDTAVGLGLEPGTQQAADGSSQFFNNSLTITGDTNVKSISLRGTGYTLYGACVGMDISSVNALLVAAGLTQSDDSWVVVFKHPADENSPVNVDGFDSRINVYTDLNGNVTEMDWSTLEG